MKLFFYGFILFVMISDDFMMGQEIIHEVTVNKSFSYQDSKDIFTLKQVGENIISGKVFFNII